MSNTLKFGAGEWAVKEGSTLAYNDENGNFKPLPFTFDRSTSATRVNKNGLIEVVGSDEPRVDYLNNANGHLLLEPSRSNLIVNSERISLSPIKNGTFVDNFAISPDGTQNATKLTSTSIDPFFYQSVSFSAGSYTASIYVKGIGNSIGKDFRIVLGSNSSNPKLQIPSEWTRFEYTATMTDGSAIAGLEIPDPAVVGDEVLVWGWQLEQGSYATSYIPTQGSAVTRVAESSSQIVPDGVIGQTEGSVYVEVNISNTTSKTILALDTGSASDFIILDTSSSLSPKILVRQSSGSFPAIITGTTMSYGVNKIAFCYKSGDYAMYVNGVLSGTSTSTTFPSGIIKRISVGANSSYGYLSDTVNDVKLYNTRLSNSELAALTS